MAIAIKHPCLSFISLLVISYYPLLTFWRDRLPSISRGRYRLRSRTALWPSSPLNSIHKVKKKKLNKQITSLAKRKRLRHWRTVANFVGRSELILLCSVRLACRPLNPLWCEKIDIKERVMLWSVEPLYAEDIESLTKRFQGIAPFLLPRLPRLVRRGADG